MGIYIKPPCLSRKEANEKTKLKNNEHIRERKEYLQTHTIAESLILTKK